MPYYSYKCLHCDTTFQTFHGMNEVVKQCDVCGCEEVDKLKRVYDKINVKVKQSKATTAGERVKEFIETSREVLDQQKEEARKEND